MNVAHGDPEITFNVQPGVFYVWTDDRTLTSVDRAPVHDARDRAVCKALLLHALDLIEAEDRRGQP